MSAALRLFLLILIVAPTSYAFADEPSYSSWASRKGPILIEKKYPSGSLRARLQAGKNAAIQKSKTWYENGKVMSFANFDWNVPSAFIVLFWPNGQKMAEIRMERGLNTSLLGGRTHKFQLFNSRQSEELAYVSENAVGANWGYTFNGIISDLNVLWNQQGAWSFEKQRDGAFQVVVAFPGLENFKTIEEIKFSEFQIRNGLLAHQHNFSIPLWGTSGLALVQDYSAGRRSGKFIVNQGDDAIVTEGAFLDGKAHGSWNGEIGNRLAGNGSFRHGLRIGAWEEHRFYSDGFGNEEKTFTSRGEYLDGKRSGAWSIDNDEWKGNYLNGKKVGVWRQRGSVAAEGAYDSDQASGPWKFQFNGSTYTGQFVSGLAEGQWFSLDPQGNTVQAVTYSKGFETGPAIWATGRGIEEGNLGPVLGARPADYSGKEFFGLLGSRLGPGCKRVGIWKIYDAARKLLIEEDYGKDGVLVSKKVFPKEFVAPSADMAERFKAEMELEASEEHNPIEKWFLSQVPACPERQNSDYLGCRGEWFVASSSTAQGSFPVGRENLDKERKIDIHAVFRIPWNEINGCASGSAQAIPILKILDDSSIILGSQQCHRFLKLSLSGKLLGTLDEQTILQEGLSDEMTSVCADRFQSSKLKIVPCYSSLNEDALQFALADAVLRIPFYPMPHFRDGQSEGPPPLDECYKCGYSGIAASKSMNISFGVGYSYWGDVHGKIVPQPFQVSENEIFLPLALSDGFWLFKVNENPQIR